MRLFYSKIKSVDGDTVRIKWNGLGWYVRIVGLDTDEMTENIKRAIRQKEILDSFLRKWIKPKLIAEIANSREGWPYIKHHNGRFLCKMYVWQWTKLGYVDYAKYMIDTKNVKKGSRWNTGG